MYPPYVTINVTQDNPFDVQGLVKIRTRVNEVVFYCISYPYRE